MSAPVVDYKPERGFRQWLMAEIYMGPDSTATGAIVPNVDDMVVDWDSGIWRVIHVDTTIVPPATKPTYIPTLMPWDITAIMQNNVSPLQRARYTVPQALDIAYLNTLVSPYTLSINDQYVVKGTDPAYCKLFKGVDVTPTTGLVISQVYDANGNFVSENVPLSQIDPNNPALKRPPVFNVTTAMYDNDIVTLVTYSQAGGPIGEQSFIIKNSNAIKGLGANTPYIIGIQLESNMIDTIQQDLIKVPANVPIAGGDFQARLIYNAGPSQLISVGTAKCKLLGVDKFNTAIAGGPTKVTLAYYPDVNEACVNAQNPSLRAVTKNYRIQTVTNNTDASFKIYVVPVFNPVTQVFTNKYYLCDLLYDMLYALNTTTQLTVTKQGGGAINYGLNQPAQTLQLSLPMSTVIPFGYSGYTFVQAVTVTYGDMSTLGWIIDYQNNGDMVYGQQALFEYSTQGQQVISVRSGAHTVTEWLARLYWALHPIYDETLVLSAPVPTHFRLKYKGILGTIRPVADYWNLYLPNEFGVNWANNDTVEVIWLASTSDVTVYQTLGVSAVRLTNTLT